MKNVILQVSKTVDKKRVPVGEVAVVIPTLEDCFPFINSKVTGEEEGLPVYEADEANFIMSAIAAYCKAAARNKLQPGTAQVKDGLQIATNWAELCAEGDRGGNGAALAILQEAKKAFAAYVATLGKSAAAAATIVSLFSNKAALEAQNEGNKQKIKGYVEAFAESLDTETLERLQRPIERVLETCEAATASDW